jgi:hypothetical protein
MIFIVSLIKYMRPREYWAGDENQDLYNVLPRYKGFSYIEIIFAHKIPTIDNIPENRTFFSQWLNSLIIRRLFRKQSKKRAIMMLC